MSEQRRGTLYGIAAYGLWGLFPLYWPLLKPADAVEILAQRMSWLLVAILVVLAVRHRWSVLAPTLRDPRKVGLLTLAAVVISLNWGVYIWGVNSGHVVETSLGYFINPIVLVLMGVLLFSERLRPAQWTALGLGVVAVAVLTVGYGRLPWIALALAFSFSTYGLVKKTVNIGAAESLGVESAVVFLPALAYLVLLEANGDATFGHEGLPHALLLAGTGVVTVVPLLFFGAAATRIPLSTVGLLQYLTPSMQFAIGVLVFDEPVPPVRLAGFALVWLALTVLSVDAVRTGRRAAAARRAQPLPAQLP
jgi:chloramphenicol-sensitive protein RarD